MSNGIDKEVISLRNISGITRESLAKEYGLIRRTIIVLKMISMLSLELALKFARVLNKGCF